LAFQASPALDAEALALRDEADGDIPFLMALYASNREAELAAFPWPPSQKAAFLHMQFNAQRTSYRTHHPNAAYKMVEVRGLPIGRLYWDELPSHLHIIDITLVPERRGRGLGTMLLDRLIAMASSNGWSVGLAVDKDNRALKLYQRMGFIIVADRGLYQQMELRPRNKP
jgi:ribosomal protein S18 acetylase RimI-like enzyme